MSISMYQASVPAFRRTLTALSKILDKAAASAGEDSARLIEARLAPDMFPLSRQVQIATDHAKGAAARLSGREVPRFEDTETTFEELQARIAKTLAFIDQIPAGEMDGSEERAIELRAGPRELKFTGLDYLTHFALPNFYFHATTAYAILRKEGIPLGKADFMGA